MTEQTPPADATTDALHFDFERNLPEVIYHYTDATGLKSILERGVFWATSYHSLNDRDEYRKGFEIVDRTVNDQLRTYPGAEGRIWGKLGEVEYMDEFFVTSFTDLEDDLGMWRGYGNGGYSIGLRTDPLRQYLTALHVSPGILGRVQYETEPIERATAQVMKAAHDGSPTVEAAHANAVALFYKSPEWEIEREIRWAGIRHGHDAPEPALIRPGRYGLARYLEIPDTARPYLEGILDSITVGPGPFQTESLESLKRLKQDLTFYFRVGQRPDVRASEISAR